MYKFQSCIYNMVVVILFNKPIGEFAGFIFFGDHFVLVM